MATATEERLSEMRTRIDRLEAKAQGAATEAKSRMRQHIDTLREHQESASVSARSRDAAFDEHLKQLDNELDIAERHLAAEITEDRLEFSAAVNAELKSWDAYLDRMQAKAAAKTGSARERAENEVARLREYRLAVTENLAQAEEGAADSWQEAKERVESGLDKLKRKADDTRNE
jgi:uncharacterized protein YjbJ (UPF0337 family)